MIGVLHAYSRTNSGDGLLVDLTLERLARCGISTEDVLLVALDPDSFAEIPHRAAAGVPGRGIAWELVPAAGLATVLSASAFGPRPSAAWRQLSRSAMPCWRSAAATCGRSTDVLARCAAQPLPLCSFRVAAVTSLYLPRARSAVGPAVPRPAALAHVMSSACGTGGVPRTFARSRTSTGS